MNPNDSPSHAERARGALLRRPTECSVPRPSEVAGPTFDLLPPGLFNALINLRVEAVDQRADELYPVCLIEGQGDLRYAQTMAFNTLVFFSLFNLFNARSDEDSAFRGMFGNKWLWAAVGLSLLLQLAVVYIPFLQKAFTTTSRLNCARFAPSPSRISPRDTAPTRSDGEPACITPPAPG